MVGAMGPAWAGANPVCAFEVLFGEIAAATPAPDLLSDKDPGEAALALNASAPAADVRTADIFAGLVRQFGSRTNGFEDPFLSQRSAEDRAGNENEDPEDAGGQVIVAAVVESVPAPPGVALQETAASKPAADAKPGATGVQPGLPILSARLRAEGELKRPSSTPESAEPSGAQADRGAGAPVDGTAAGEEAFGLELRQERVAQPVVTEAETGGVSVRGSAPAGHQGAGADRQSDGKPPAAGHPGDWPNDGAEPSRECGPRSPKGALEFLPQRQREGGSPGERPAEPRDIPAERELSSPPPASLAASARQSDSENRQSVSAADPGQPEQPTPDAGRGFRQLEALRLQSVDLMRARSVQDVSIRIPGTSDSPVDIRLSARGDALDISVRAADPALASELRGDLPKLVEALEREGYQKSGVQAPEEHPVPGSHPGTGRWSYQEGGQSQQRRREPQPSKTRPDGRQAGANEEDEFQIELETRRTS